MFRNSPTQVRQNTDCGGIKTKHCQCAWLRYVVGHHRTSQQNKGGPLCPKMAVDACKHLEMSLFSRKMWWCLTSSRCRPLGSVECNQGVTKTQFVLYLIVSSGGKNLLQYTLPVVTNYPGVCVYNIYILLYMLMH